MADPQAPNREADEAELRRLNQAVTDALAARKAWMDDAMLRYSPVKPGDEIWDIGNGRRLGVVVGLYRYWSGRNDLLDTSLSIDVRYEDAPNSFDNTSRQTSLHWGSKQQAMQHMDRRLAGIRRG